MWCGDAKGANAAYTQIAARAVVVAVADASVDAVVSVDASVGASAAFPLIW